VDGHRRQPIASGDPALDAAAIPTDRRQFRGLVLVLIAFCLAILAQRSLTVDRLIIDGLLLYALTGFLVIRALGVGDVPPFRPFAAQRTADVGAVASPRAHRGLLGGVAVASGMLAFVTLEKNTFTPLGTVAWLTACGAFLAATWDWPSGSWWRERLAAWRRPRAEPRLSWTLLVLTLVLLVAAFYRFYQLDATPAEPTSDHIEKLLDVREIMNGRRPIFLPNNAGREAIMFYWTAGLSSLLGFGFLTLKFSAALAGLLSIPAVFLLARELFNPRVGLIAAFVVAISKWHVNITRLGLRFPFSPLFSALSLYFLYRALRANRRNDWLLAGLLLGLGQFGYTTMRIMPLVFAAWIAAKLILDRDFGPAGLRGFVGNILASAGAAALAVLPMARYAYEFPQDFFRRTLTRSTGAEEPLVGDTALVFLDNMKNGLLAFNWRGDRGWFHNLSNDPLLDPVSGALFVIGVCYLGWLLLRRDVRAAYLGLAFLMLLLPSTLAVAFPAENPSTSRMSAAIPIVAIVVALPVWLVAERARRALPGWGGTVFAVLFAATLGILAARLNYHSYFVEYDRAYRLAAPNTSEIGRVVRGFADSVGDLQHAYYVSWPHWVDHRNIALMAGDIMWRNELLDIERARDHMADSAPKLYVLNVADEKSAAVLRALYPTGQYRIERSAVGKDFAVFFVPGA
jgi:drug/metabolite transporter superfamily protein YnfA